MTSYADPYTELVVSDAMREYTQFAVPDEEEFAAAGRLDPCTFVFHSLEPHEVRLREAESNDPSCFLHASFKASLSATVTDPTQPGQV